MIKWWSHSGLGIALFSENSGWHALAVVGFPHLNTPNTSATGHELKLPPDLPRRGRNLLPLFVAWHAVNVNPRLVYYPLHTTRDPKMEFMIAPTCSNYKGHPPHHPSFCITLVAPTLKLLAKADQRPGRPSHHFWCVEPPFRRGTRRGRNATPQILAKFDFEGKFLFNRLGNIVYLDNLQCLGPARSRSPQSLKMSRRPGWVLQFSAGLADIAFKNSCLIWFREEGVEHENGKTKGWN